MASYLSKQEDICMKILLFLYIIILLLCIFWEILFLSSSQTVENATCHITMIQDTNYFCLGLFLKL